MSSTDARPSWREQSLRGVLRHYPLNAPRISLLGKLPGVPRGCCPFRAKGGIRIHGCHEGDRDIISKSLYYLGDFDPWVIALLRALATPGSTVVDVGANIGVMTLRLSDFVGVAGKVISFEPFPINLDLLRKNVEGNRCTNVEVIGDALSDRSGACRVGMADMQPGHVSVLPDDSPVDGAVVRTRTLDEFVAERGLGSVSTCKIDVEGFEFEVLSGARSALANQVIESFVFERHLDADVGQDHVFDLLRANGYQIWRAWKRCIGVSLAEPGRRCAGRVTDDFVAVASGSRAGGRIARLIRRMS